MNLPSPDHNPLRRFVIPFLFLYGAIGVVFPFYSLWLSDWGLTDSQVAFVNSVYGLSVVVWSQLWGYAADMLFARRTLLIVNTLAAVAMFSLLPWTQGVILLSVVTFLYASFLTPNGQLLNSLLLSQHQGERRYSVIRSAGTVGFILTSLLIGMMSRRYGTAVIFLFYGGILGSFCLSMIPIREIPPKRRRRVSGKAGISAGEVPSEVLPGSGASPYEKRLSFLETQKVFWNRRAIRRFLIFVVVYQLAHALSHAFQGIWIRELGGAETTVSYSYSIAAGCELLVLWMVDRWLERRSAVPFLVVASVTQAVRWGLLFLFPTLWVNVASNVFHAVTFGLFYASAVVYIHRLSPPTLRTTGQTLFGLAYFGLAALGSNLLGSWVIRLAGVRSWYGVAAGLGVVAAVLALFIPQDDYSARVRSDGVGADTSKSSSDS